MLNERKAANALGGKTARACDGCLQKRARWFCPSDDAFLCQSCDTSVHSANQLASRHSRVRLETASSKPVTSSEKIEPWSPLWYEGFTRKARSPRSRNGKNTLLAKSKLLNSLPLVPEIGNEEEGNMVVVDSEDQLPFRVPVFDPFTEELNDILTKEEPERANENKLDDFLELQLPSDIDLGEFENLLRNEFDEDEEPPHVKSFEKDVKIKDEAITDCNWEFCLHLPVVDEGGNEQEKEEKVVPVSGFVGLMMDDESKDETKKNMFLRLNYEAVISAWGGQGSPCNIGNGSQLSDCQISGYLVGASPKDFHPPFGGASGQPAGSDRGREARVLRYKEKRRTRLFSKKIRYEVRKLNAEKRPRMKGRFVKRTSFAGNLFPCVNYNK